MKWFTNIGGFGWIPAYLWQPSQVPCRKEQHGMGNPVRMHGFAMIYFLIFVFTVIICILFEFIHQSVINHSWLFFYCSLFRMDSILLFHLRRKHTKARHWWERHLTASLARLIGTSTVCAPSPAGDTKWSPFSFVFCFISIQQHLVNSVHWVLDLPCMGGEWYLYTIYYQVLLVSIFKVRSFWRKHIKILLEMLQIFKLGSVENNEKVSRLCLKCVNK